MTKVSIFTPSHHPEHLAEVYESLQAQTFTDWEWVVIANGSTRSSDVPTVNKRVRVFMAPNDIKGVGALKRWAVERCSGDVLVELDHDDLLAPQALESIVKAVEAGAGFVYSDFCNFRQDETYEVYDIGYGWEHYLLPAFKEQDGNRIQPIAHRAFPVNPSSLRTIFWAPNHVRTWTREAYAKTGGYDAALDICDDYDLVLRTYLAGVDMVHIPECLYFYRLHDDKRNTYLKRNAEIQLKQAEVSERYMGRVIHEWCRREKLPMFDLGGGLNPAAGFSSLDLRENADVICDVRFGLPFQDSTVGALRAFDFLEHIPHCRNSSCTHGQPFCTVGLMNEIYRVLVPGGWLLTGTPSTDGRGAFQDPTHCSWWNRNSWFYYTRSEQQRFVPGIKARFQMARVVDAQPNDWCKTHNIWYNFADLIALKGQRQPGIVEI